MVQILNVLSFSPRASRSISGRVVVLVVLVVVLLLLVTHSKKLETRTFLTIQYKDGAFKSNLTSLYKEDNSNSLPSFNPY